MLDIDGEDVFTVQHAGSFTMNLAIDEDDAWTLAMMPSHGTVGCFQSSIIL